MKEVRGGVCCSTDAAVFTRFGQTFGVRSGNIGQHTSGASFLRIVVHIAATTDSLRNPPPPGRTD